MRSKLLIQLLIVFLPLLSFGQQRWETILGNLYVDDYPAEIITDYDGGYLITSLDILQQNTLYKTDRNGDLLWKKVFINNNGTYFNGAAFAEKNGIKIIVGNLGNYAFIWSLNECGDLMWCSEFINNQNYLATDYRDIVLLSDKIIVMGTLQLYDYNYVCALFGFDYYGNLLWTKDILNPANDSLMGNAPVPAYLNKIDNHFFISGFCYYAYPDNPNLAYLRAMFIDVDSIFNKKWFLPYGMQDSLFADGRGVAISDSGIWCGYGTCFVAPPTDTLNSVFMYFDTEGDEIRHKSISNNTISPEVKDNDLMALNIINDSIYLITAQVGSIPLTVNPIGEFTVDMSGTTVYQYQNHPGAYANLHPTAKTEDNRFVFVARKQNAHKDILLYKLNADLSQAAIDTNSYVYDSLCPHPITSDTIYLKGCDVITAVPQYPTPEAYYQAKNSVEITAYPNPAHGIVNFELENTQYQIFLELTVYDMAGHRLLARPVATSQKELRISTSGFSPGIYVAVVRNERKVLGKGLFSVY